MDSLTATLFRRGDLNGSILVAENGVPIYEKSFGYANFLTKEKINYNTSFELASVSKQFTAMAIMQLHEKKKLSYEDKASTYLVALPYKDVTIRNLLQHTSGIVEMLEWDSTFIDFRKKNDNTDVLKILAARRPPLLFDPGEKIMYSNTNYVLLALIVEHVSGYSFSEYMSRSIFAPLGMNDTHIGLRKKNVIPKNEAIGYVYEPRQSRFVQSNSMSQYRYVNYLNGIEGPFGISSSMEDLLKWDHALSSGQLVSQTEQNNAYVPARLKDGTLAQLGNLAYGFGWIIGSETAQKGRKYFHSGGFPGYYSFIARYAEKHKTVIILLNQWNTINMHDLAWAIEEIVFGNSFSVPKKLQFQKCIALTETEIKMVTGSYFLKDAPQIKVAITREFDQVFAQLTSQPRAEIYPKSDTEYFYSAVEAKIHFQRDKNGQVDGLIILQGGQQIVAVKEEASRP